MVKKKKTPIPIKLQLLIATSTVLLLVAFGLFVGWLDSSMPSSGTSRMSSISLSDVTLKGESVCLTHKGDGPHTMECVMGIKTTGGTVYAIKGEAVPAADNSLEVTGTLKPASKHHKYITAGTLTVK